MPAAAPQAAMELPVVEPLRGAMPILAFFFSATWFVQGAMAAHLPGLLQAAGAWRPRQSRLPRWSVRLRSAPVSLSSDYCVRSTRSPRRGLLSRRRRRFCLACCSIGSGSMRWDYRLGYALPLSARCSLALGIVRAAGIRPAQRAAIGAGPDAPGVVAVSVWLAARADRNRCGRIVGRPLPRRFRLAVPAAPALRRRGTTLTGAQLGADRWATLLRRWHYLFPRQEVQPRPD